MTVNRLGQPIGEPLPEWVGCEAPSRTTIQGHYCRLEPLDIERHGPQLFDAYRADQDGRIWTYLPFGPFDSPHELTVCLKTDFSGADPLCFVIVDNRTNLALGMASYMRIVPSHGVIEVGALTYSPLLQQTPMSTEAMYLMMKRAFDDLGYRRYEWKCDVLNEPSRNAAERLGFRFEGIFRQATVYKHRNRDTAWFSILDSEWPILRSAFEQWLSPANFDADGKQIRSLASLRPN